jgi:hypothetical protein
MSGGQHTAGLWLVAEGSGTIIIASGRGDAIATTYGEGAEANARFIVDACNNHDALIERAEAAEAELAESRAVGRELLHALITCRNALGQLQQGIETNITTNLAVADVAIAKAKEAA